MALGQRRRVGSGVPGPPEWASGVACITAPGSVEAGLIEATSKARDCAHTGSEASRRAAGVERRMVWFLIISPGRGRRCLGVFPGFGGAPFIAEHTEGARRTQRKPFWRNEANFAEVGLSSAGCAGPAAEAGWGCSGMRASCGGSSGSAGCAGPAAEAGWGCSGIRASCGGSSGSAGCAGAAADSGLGLFGCAERSR